MNGKSTHIIGPGSPIVELEDLLATITGKIVLIDQGKSYEVRRETNLFSVTAVSLPTPVPAWYQGQLRRTLADGFLY